MFKLSTRKNRKIRQKCYYLRLPTTFEICFFLCFVLGAHEKCVQSFHGIKYPSLKHSIYLPFSLVNIFLNQKVFLKFGSFYTISDRCVKDPLFVTKTLRNSLELKSDLASWMSDLKDLIRNRPNRDNKYFDTKHLKWNKITLGVILFRPNRKSCLQ